MTLHEFENGNYIDHKACYYLLKSGKLKAGKIIHREYQLHNGFYFIHSSHLDKYKVAERKKDLITCRQLRREINLKQFLEEVVEIREMAG